MPQVGDGGGGAVKGLPCTPSDLTSNSHDTKIKRREILKTQKLHKLATFTYKEVAWLAQISEREMEMKGSSGYYCPGVSGLRILLNSNERNSTNTLYR